jgi:chemotaxis protein histidine kinase CheA
VGKLLKTLAKIGLVELNDNEHTALGEENESPLEATAHDPLLQEHAEAPETESSDRNRAPASSQDSDQAGIEGRSFEEIYYHAQIPASSYPAEKLLKLLDGLRALDPATRKAAVTAMDAADEEWRMEDAVSDAQHKIEALQEAGAALVQVVAQAESKTRADLDAQERYQQEASASIRRQIAELEALLEQELNKVADEKALIQARLQQIREACARETHRYTQEITRLKEILDSFGKAVPSHAPPSSSNPK